MKKIILGMAFLSLVSSAETRLVQREYERSHERVGKLGLGFGVLWAKDGSQSRYLEQIELQYVILRHATVGFIGQFANNSKGRVDVPTFALGGALNYYSIAPFHGFWFQAGLKEHFYNNQPGTERYRTTTGAFSTVGWRWRNIPHGLSFGTAVGAERFFDSGANTVPIASADIAVDFNPDELFD